MSLIKKIVHSVTKPISNVIDSVFDTGSSILSPVTDTIGSTLNSVTGVKDQMNLTYDQQKAMMNAQNAYNKEMWNLQNEYNSPASQLARMRDAGIDVNPLSYALGTGNLSNTASNVSSASGFSGAGSPAGNPISMLMGVASGVQGIRESKARTQNMEEQVINTMIQGNNMLTQGTRTKLENDIMRHNLKYAQEHGMPVNTVPGIDASAGSYMNEFLNFLKKNLT